MKQPKGYLVVPIELKNGISSYCQLYINYDLSEITGRN